ncbi:MAG TPA: LpqB family beta-propeller domain-containing protein [Gaiellaceae bacterium]|nr:LpqB family beta-propeller domain-containing protein [Gaiellaceae bacterium]
MRRRLPFALFAVALAAGLSAPSSAPRSASRGTIVFASTRAATLIRPAVYTIGVDGRGRRRITPPFGGASLPVWSPSGRWIAFESNERVYVVPARGGRPRRVAPRFAVTSPVWSPDGARLALVATRGESTDLIVARAGGWRGRRVGRDIVGRPSWSPDAANVAVVGRDGNVLAVDARTARRRVLYRPRVSPAEVTWSPDGSRLAFTHTDPANGVYEIYVADLRTRRERRIAQGMVEPAWSPDGMRIAAKAGAYIYVMRSDGQGRLRVARDDYDELPSHPPVWSPDGGRLAVAYGEIYAVRASGRGRSRVTHESPRSQLPFLEEASWSPDGRRLAYVSVVRDPGDFDLYTLPASGGRPQALTKNWLSEAHPSWSPDGRTVALTRYRRRVAYVALLRRGAPARVLVRGSEPAWSPDGARIAFVRAGDVHVVRADGTNQRALTSGAPEDSSPDWSPDGRELVFARFTPEGRDLWALRLDGTGLRRLTDVRRGLDRCAVAEASSPAWSPDGLEVAFSLLEGGNIACALRGGWYSIHAVKADGSAQTRLVTEGGRSDPLSGDGGFAPVWSPDGAEIAFVSRIGEGRERLAIVPRAGGRFRFLTPGLFDAMDPDWRS